MRNIGVVLILLSVCLAQTTFGQDRHLTISQLQDSIAIQGKAVMLLIHTDWCTYCAMQKHQLSDKSQQYSIYFAEFNAEQKETVLFKGKDYPFKPTGKNTGTHSLVYELAGSKKISYPLWVILDKQLDVIETYSGYLKPDELDKIAKALSE